jgi:hypothetical protein
MMSSFSFQTVVFCQYSSLSNLDSEFLVKKSLNFSDLESASSFKGTVS